MTHRGPIRSTSRPTGMPTNAATTSPIEKAPVMTSSDQPVVRVMLGARTGKA